MVQLDGDLYMWLRLTFGGTSNPTTWCAMSELQTDQANDIMSDTSWDLTDLATLDEIASLPPIYRLQDDIPYAQAEQTMVLPPPCPFGASNMFVDDDHTVTVDINNYTTRAHIGMFASVNTLARPIHCETYLASTFSKGRKHSTLADHRRSNSSLVGLSTHVHWCITPTRETSRLDGRSPSIHCIQRYLQKGSGENARPRITHYHSHPPSPLLPRKVLPQTETVPK
jgi:hypothetical protein